MLSGFTQSYCSIFRTLGLISVRWIQTRLLAVDWVVFIVGWFNLRLICNILVAKLKCFENGSSSFWASRDLRESHSLESNILKGKEQLYRYLQPVWKCSGLLHPVLPQVACVITVVTRNQLNIFVWLKSGAFLCLDPFQIRFNKPWYGVQHVNCIRVTHHRL